MHGEKTMKPEIISGKEKEQILSLLQIYGINKINFLLVKSGKDRIRAVSFTNLEKINEISDGIFTETFGIYFARIDGEEVRLTIDACHLLKDQIKNNILELDEAQFEAYMKGHETEINKSQEELNNKKIYFVLKHKDDFLGMAKISNKMIKNYLPKERRRKS